MIVNANAYRLPLASNTVQCVVTSPPYYGLRDYGVDGQIGHNRKGRNSPRQAVYWLRAEFSIYSRNSADSIDGTADVTGGFLNVT